jgi:hypothetical protein
MELQRQVMMPDGTIRDNHKIIRITHNVNYDQTVIDVESTRKNIGGYITQLGYELNFNMTLEDAYAELASDPNFQEYIDPAQEALNDLLPTITDEQAELIPSIFPE